MEIRRGDILREGRGIIVHSANARCVMGAGIALKIKKKYPGVFADYVSMLIDPIHTNAKYSGMSFEQSVLGKCITTIINDDLYIVTGIGQLDYGNNLSIVYTDYGAIKSIFTYVNKLAITTGLPVLFPRIGCGLGGGDWDIISRIITDCLSPEVESVLFIL